MLLINGRKVKTKTYNLFNGCKNFNDGLNLQRFNLNLYNFISSGSIENICYYNK